MVRSRRISCLIIAVISLGSLWSAAHSAERRPDVSFVGTPHPAVLEMLKTAQVTQNDIVYDLGCGDGRFVITAAKLFRARGVGIDIDPPRIQESTENALQAGVADRVRFVQADLFETDISEATVVTLYLLTGLNLKLRPKLFRECKPGTRIVSHEFDMGEWKPDRVGVVPNVKIFYQPDLPQEKDTYFYYWVIPADVDGLWRWTSPGKRNFTLRLHQKFQEISGKIKLDGREVSIEDARLVGDQLSFTLTDRTAGQKAVMRFNGRVSGNTIQGNVDVQGDPLAGKQPWTANRSF